MSGSSGENSCWGWGGLQYGRKIASKPSIWPKNSLRLQSLAAQRINGHKMTISSRKPPSADIESNASWCWQILWQKFPTRAWKRACLGLVQAWDNGCPSWQSLNASLPRYKGHGRLISCSGWRGIFARLPGRKEDKLNVQASLISSLQDGCFS